MKHSGQLPCLELLLVASALYDLKILVYFWSSEPITYVYNKNSSSVVHLQCLSGIHFNALVEKTCGAAATDHCSQSASSVLAGISNMSVRERKVYFQCDKCQQSDHPKIKVGVGSQEFCAILDCGAEISLVRESSGIFVAVNGQS